MKPLFLALTALFGLVLASCSSNSAAPEGSPRVEVELRVEVDEAVFSPFDPSVDREAILELIDGAVQPLADVGLRFYPVPAEVYTEGDERPEYALTVRVEKFEVTLDHELIEEENKDPWIQTEIEQAECTVLATFEKRRNNAPPLQVGTEAAMGESGENRELEGEFLLEYVTQTGGRLNLSREAFASAVDQAVARVLAKLQKPIDREFKPKTD
ncbi:MAG: hypothetical protein AAF682_08315 [Planctomycetota bacterium]